MQTHELTSSTEQLEARLDDRAERDSIGSATSLFDRAGIENAEFSTPLNVVTALKDTMIKGFEPVEQQVSAIDRKTEACTGRIEKMERGGPQSPLQQGRGRQTTTSGQT